MRPAQLIFAMVFLLAACPGEEDKDGKATESGATESGTEAASGASSSGTTSPWGEDYAGHYKPPPACRDDEVADFAGRGMACMPACINGMCPPASPETVGKPACEIDLDDVPGPDHCIITCSQQTDCQGDGYTCNPDGWCSWP